MTTIPMLEKELEQAYKDLNYYKNRNEKLNNQLQQKEIERLNQELEKYKYSADELNEIERLNNIIKEVRELRNKISNLYYEDGFELDTPMLLKNIDEILDKGE